MRLMTLCVLASVSTSAMSYQDREAAGDAGTRDAWKITSIVYSINLASLDKK